MEYFKIWRKIADSGIGQWSPLCDKWRHYRGWLEDVTQLPDASPEARFRRLDPNRLYEPGNVQWVPKGKRRPTGKITGSRKGQVFFLTLNGQPITQTESARILNTNPNAFRQRLIYKSWRTGQTHFDLNEFLWD